MRVKRCTLSTEVAGGTRVEDLRFAITSYWMGIGNQPSIMMNNIA